MNSHQLVTEKMQAQIQMHTHMAMKQGASEAQRQRSKGLGVGTEGGGSGGQHRRGMSPGYTFYLGYVSPKSFFHVRCQSLSRKSYLGEF